MDELINEYRERMGWNDQSIISILTSYIQCTSMPYHTPISFRDYIEQRALDEEEVSDG